MKKDRRQLDSWSASRSRFLFSLRCELLPIICPYEPEGLPFGVLGEIGQAPAGFGFEAKLCWMVGHMLEAKWLVHLFITDRQMSRRPMNRDSLFAFIVAQFRHFAAVQLRRLLLILACHAEKLASSFP